MVILAIDISGICDCKILAQNETMNIARYHKFFETLMNFGMAVKSMQSDYSMIKADLTFWIEQRTI